jgi:alpha-D-xyloside xylohydrolase
LFGSDLLVAPLLESGSRGRNVYLPPGRWIDYQTGRTYAAGWHAIDAGEIPVVLLVRDGAVIPHIGLAQSTAFLDWSKLEAVVFATSSTTTAHGKVALPTGGDLLEITLQRRGKGFTLGTNPLGEKVAWTVRQR